MKKPGNLTFKLIILLMVCLMLQNCRSNPGKTQKEDNPAEPVSRETGSDFRSSSADRYGLQSVMKDVVERHRMDFEIVPVGIPEWLEHSSDQDMQKIAAIMKLINASRDYLFPTDSLTIMFNRENFTQVSVSYIAGDDQEWDCVTIGAGMYICTKKWTANNGKLNLEFVDSRLEDYYRSYLVLDGIDYDGREHDNFMIQEWMEKTDLTESTYRINQVTEPCGFGPLFTIKTEVIGSGLLSFAGEERRTDTYKYTIQTDACMICNAMHLIIPRSQIVLCHYPDNKYVFETWNLDLKRCILYLWIKYVIMPDKSWSKVVYNEEGIAISYSSGNA